YTAKMLELFVAPPIIQDLCRYQQCFQVPQVSMTERVVASEACGRRFQCNGYLFAYRLIVDRGQGNKARKADARRPMAPGCWIPRVISRCQHRVSRRRWLLTRQEVGPVARPGRKDTSFIRQRRAGEPVKTFLATDGSERKETERAAGCAMRHPGGRFCAHGIFPGQ